MQARLPDGASARAPDSAMTASTASASKLPWNTANCDSTDRSVGSSKSHDQSSVARKVAWRSGRPPRDSNRSKRRCMRCSSTCGGITRTRAAASSIASGKPSSDLASWSTALRSAAFGAKLWWAALARRRKSSTASWLSSGGSANTVSPGMPSTSRLVTRN